MTWVPMTATSAISPTPGAASARPTHPLLALAAALAGPPLIAVLHAIVSASIRSASHAEGLALAALDMHVYRAFVVVLGSFVVLGTWRCRGTRARALFAIASMVASLAIDVCCLLRANGTVMPAPRDMPWAPALAAAVLAFAALLVTTRRGRGFRQLVAAAVMGALLLAGAGFAAELVRDGYVLFGGIFMIAGGAIASALVVERLARREAAIHPVVAVLAGSAAFVIGAMLGGSLAAILVAVVAVPRIG
jgi:hypothetical protein